MDEQTTYDYKKLYEEEKLKCNTLAKQNQYFGTKIRILENSHNKGEKDEVLLLLKLFFMNQIEQYDKLIDIFGEDASEGIRILDIGNKEEIEDMAQLSKAKGDFKADCIIEMKKTKTVYCISIKSKNGANPAILNHTPRSAKVFSVGGNLYDCLDALDTIIEGYIDKRTKALIGEDVSITTLDLPTSIKTKFMDVLSYFIFEGSGKGDSKCKANAILTYNHETITFNECITLEQKKEYIEAIYDNIILSLRDKGMPKVLVNECKKWLFYDNKNVPVKYKGSLHIRMK